MHLQVQAKSAMVRLRLLALLQSTWLALLPVVAQGLAPSPCLAAVAVQVRLTLTDGKVVEGTLLRRAVTGYVLRIAGEEQHYAYYQVERADEWPVGARPPDEPPPAEAAPPSVPVPAADPKPEPTAKPVPAAKPVPVRKPEPPASPQRPTPVRPEVRRPAPKRFSVQQSEAPEVPGRGMATVGWIIFGVTGGGATLFGLEGGASHDPQLQVMLMLGVVSGLALAIGGIGRRAAGMEQLNEWRRARGLPPVDEPPDEAKADSVSDAPAPTWTLAPTVVPGGGAGLVLGGSF